MGLDRSRIGSFRTAPVVDLDYRFSARQLAAGFEVAPDAPFLRRILGFLVYCRDADSGDLCQSERISGLHTAGLSLDAGRGPLQASRTSRGSAGARAGGCGGRSGLVSWVRPTVR